MIVTPGESRARPLLHQTGILDHPDVSPDGRWLAYSAWLSLQVHRGSPQVVQQLWRLDLRRGRAGLLLGGTANDLHPRWSPDGRRLVFVSNRQGGWQLWQLPAEGGTAKPLTHSPGAKTSPAWSPDGRWVLYTRIGEAGYRLWRIRADGSGAGAFEPLGPGVSLRDADWR